MAVVKVTCMSCGDVTVFTDGTPNNDHIEKTNGSSYKCNSCNNKTGDFPVTFKEETL